MCSWSSCAAGHHVQRYNRRPIIQRTVFNVTQSAWNVTARILTMIFGGIKSSPSQAALSISLSSSHSASSSSPSSNVPEEVWRSPPGSRTQEQRARWKDNTQMKLKRVLHLKALHLLFHFFPSNSGGGEQGSYNQTADDTNRHNNTLLMHSARCRQLQHNAPGGWTTGLWTAVWMDGNSHVQVQRL